MFRVCVECCRQQINVVNFNPECWPMCSLDGELGVLGSNPVTPQCSVLFPTLHRFFINDAAQTTVTYLALFEK